MLPKRHTKEVFEQNETIFAVANKIVEEPYCPTYSLMRIFRIPALLLALLIPSFSIGAEEILSKKDAEQTFTLSFAEWTSNLKKVSLSGAGKVAIAGEYDWTLLMPNAGGILKVTPSYLPSNLNRPHKISIGVEQAETASAVTRNLSNVQIKDMIAKWHSEMLPEFTAMTNLDLAGKTAQFNITLFEVGVYPALDTVGKMTKGCWEECIKR